MKKKWIIILSLLIVATYLGYNYLYQEHRNILEEEPTHNLTTQVLISSFSQDNSIGREQYLNNTIIVSGQITRIDGSSITLDNTVYCSFTENINEGFDLNQSIKIKGRCIGYDDLLNQVKLDQCSIVNY